MLTPPGASLDMLVTLCARPSHPTPTRASVEGKEKNILYRREGRARRVKATGSPVSKEGRLVCPPPDWHHATTLPCLLPLPWGLGGRPVTPPACLGFQVLGRGAGSPQLQLSPPRAGPGRCCHRGGGGSGMGQAPAGAPR